jgi:hypothetical protein
MRIGAIAAIGAALAAGIALPFIANAQPPVSSQACPAEESEATSECTHEASPRVNRCRPAECPGAKAGCGLARIKEQPKAPTLLVNSRRLKLNYSMADVGPSGVSRLELWATRDGKSWARYSNEPPPEGPLSVQVAEEGKYGFAIVLTNGVGVRSQEPRQGDTPHLWVVVDETAPAVKLGGVEVLPEGKMCVRWTASDERLMPRPVTISMAVKPEGPFTPVATALENTGKHVYQIPRDHPYEAYIRVEAADAAGNVGHDTTPVPVKVDLRKPKGMIIGVDSEKHVSGPVAIPALERKQADPRVMHFVIGFGK